MTAEELDRLIHRYFEGGLSPEEETRLWQFVRSESTAADRFVELSELESALVESLKAEEAAPPEVSSPGRGSKRRTRVLPTPPTTRRTVWPLLFAAGLLAGFVAIVSQSTSKPQPVEVVRLPEPPLLKPAPEAPVAKPETPAAPRRSEATRPPEEPFVVPPRTVVAPKPVEPAPVEAKPTAAPGQPAIEKPAAPAETKIADARVEKVEGDVVDAAGAPARAGQAMVSGEGLEVRGAKGSAAVVLADGTRVELRPDTRLERLLVSGTQKRLVLSRGTAVSTVVKQPAKMAVVFETPHSEVTVLGTKLTVEIGRESTRVEVQEGRVRCKRMPDGASTEIAAGRFAVAGKGPAPAAKPIQVVRSFQDGVAPAAEYAGTRDTWISSAEPNANFAKGDLLRLQRLSGHLTTLIRWDVSSIPPGSRVVSAELTFWVTGKLVGPVKLFDLRRPFDESEATWRTAGGGRSWGTIGAQSDGDRGAKPVATLAPEKTGFSTIPMNELGVALIQDWINAPAGNFGILVAGPDANEWNLDSRESLVPDRRPKLTITFIPAAK